MTDVGERAVHMGMPRTRPGAFRHRVSIQEKDNATQDSMGQYGTAESTITDGTRYAAIEPFSELERDTGSTFQPERKFIVTMWYFAGVTPKMWVLFGTRKLEIVQILDEGEIGSVMRLMCIERDV